jgi:hypothetical protein
VASSKYKSPTHICIHTAYTHCIYGVLRNINEKHLSQTHPCNECSVAYAKARPRYGPRCTIQTYKWKQKTEVKVSQHVNIACSLFSARILKEGAVKLHLLGITVRSIPLAGGVPVRYQMVVSIFQLDSALILACGLDEQPPLLKAPKLVQYRISRYDTH